LFYFSRGFLKPCKKKKKKKKKREEEEEEKQKKKLKKRPKIFKKQLTKSYP